MVDNGRLVVETKKQPSRVTSSMPVQYDSVNYVAYVVFNFTYYGIQLDGTWVEDAYFDYEH